MRSVLLERSNGENQALVLVESLFDVVPRELIEGV